MQARRDPRERRKSTRCSLVLTAAILAASTASLFSAGPASAGARLDDVVVTHLGAPVGDSETVAAVTAAGGHVVSRLPLISGVVARLPHSAQLPAGFLVAPQRRLTVTSTTQGDSSTAAAVSLRAELGMQARDAQGAGVKIAVVDTGIANVPDLAGKVAEHVDFSGSGQGDGYGHGTFMAGLIAASGAASAGLYAGVAPAAQLVDVKVAASDGSTDLTTVLRGLQWVSDHHSDVRVVNLSMSSGSSLPYQIDPLTQALEALWREGVTVVVPSGNDGPQPGSVTSPGIDPTLLTVGGLDNGGTYDRADDAVADWSGRSAPGAPVKPDVVAPGAHLISLRAPGSIIDQTYPDSRVGDSYFRGSGTSMSTAVTSGVAADLLSARPRLQPDQIKALLTSTAYRTSTLAVGSGAGAGGIDPVAALAAPVPAPAPGSNNSTSIPVTDLTTWQALSNAFLAHDLSTADSLWNALSPASRAWASRAWAGLDPASRAWASRAWAGETWAGVATQSADWASRAWASHAWAGTDWASRAWAATGWSALTWTSRAWAGDDWASRAWASDEWTSRAWSWLPPGG